MGDPGPDSRCSDDSRASRFFISFVMHALSRKGINDDLSRFHLL
jgi:hypothetical protein